MSRIKSLAALSAGLVLAVSTQALAQGSAVNEYGEFQGVKGRAVATVTVPEGSFATLFATARVSGGFPVGTGMLTRAGVGVDIFVNDKLCSSDRDVRRQVEVETFEGDFATSTTCITVLKGGSHEILAERTHINVEGAKVQMKYSILGGEPDRITTPAE